MQIKCERSQHAVETLIRLSSKWEGFDDPKEIGVP